jgi:hypothetical protein
MAQLSETVIPKIRAITATRKTGKKRVRPVMPVIYCLTFAKNIFTPFVVVYGHPITWSTRINNDF